MILFAYGNDSYLLREKVADWISQYKAKNKNAFNISFYAPKTFDINEFKRSLSTVGMFSEKKLAVLEGFASFAHAEKLIEFMRDADIKEKKDIFIIFSEYCEPAEDKREGAKREMAFEKNKLVTFLKKSAFKTEQTNAPKGAKLHAWIEKEFQKRGAEIDAKAINMLISFASGSMWLLASEIEKLSLYSTHVTHQEVALLVSRAITPDIFKTIDELAARNKATALAMLHEHIEKGDSPLQLMSMFVFQFRNIYVAKKLGSSTFPKILSLHPFVQQKARAQSRNFSLKEIARVYQKLFEADVAIKTGDMQPHTALDLFVASAV